MKWGSSPKFVHNLELIAFEYNMHKHGILTPSITIRTNDTKWNRLLWLPQSNILNKMRKLPKVHAQCAQHGILAPSKSFKTQTIARNHKYGVKLNMWEAWQSIL